MGVFFYNIFLLIYQLGIRTACLFNPKARKWVEGRRGIFDRMKAVIPSGEKIVWMHCASLGEFEQGRPVLEEIKTKEPQTKILLTFFSPSGYEIRKDYDGADWVFYLPMDGAGNANRFLDIVQPNLAIFVKYEFWYYFLTKAKHRKIPVLLISAAFRKDSPFFKWYGGLYRKMLHQFDHLFIQNNESQTLLEKIGIKENMTVAGDTRFDRVFEIASNFKPILQIEEYLGDQKAFVAGSTWPEDERMIQKAFSKVDAGALRLIIAPHEIDEIHLGELKKLFPDSILFSQLSQSRPIAPTLIIDNIGMLSRIYRYAWITYVGGAMSKRGIHNVLEAAVYDKIVLFGPNYEKYMEVTGLVKAGGGIPIHDINKDGALLHQLIEAMLADETEYQFRSKAAGDYVRNNRGATEKIMKYIQENRLLTS